jgi:hypothetical protein
VPQQDSSRCALIADDERSNDAAWLAPADLARQHATEPYLDVESSECLLHVDEPALHLDD